MDPLSLGINGSTQPEIFEDTVDAMARSLLTNADRFWRSTYASDGPLEVWRIGDELWLACDGELEPWRIGDELWLANGNHRFHAALRAKVEIPNEVRLIDKTGSQVATFSMENLTWLPGCKRG